MVDDAHSKSSDPDAVIPPPPAADRGDLASSVPLAPPLSGAPTLPATQPPVSGGPFGPPAPPLPPYAAGLQPGAPAGPPAPPAPPLPPYTAAQQPGQYPGQYPAGQPGQYPTHYPVGQQAPTPYGAEYPYPAAPPSAPSRSGRTVGIVIAAVAAFLLIVVVGIGVAVSLLLGSSSEPVSAPVPTVTADTPTAPSEEPSTDDPPTDDSGDSGDADASAIGDVLQAKIDEYKQLRDSGALWEKIPDSEFNRTAVSAFLYFLVDMKSATLWGVDEAQAQEYQERMTMLEERLLAEEPLGDDIKITLEDKVFTYDGTTGEGGYTAK
ncbi:hypothetical protein ACTJKH_13525 [Microbacterium sp. 22215]|uniref:hypothetical protein n=1 Tax=Microbacterium sp. 22215 TaxID=3453893 RepID=UPI003F84E4B7